MHAHPALDDGAAAVEPRRIARHRERVRRARRSERARAQRQGHRLVLHRPAGFPDAAATSRMPRSRAIRGGKHGYTPSAGIDELRAAAARDMRHARAASTSAPDDVVVGAGAKPFIAYAIASVTDYGAGDEVIYPVPGLSDLRVADRRQRRRAGADLPARGARFRVRSGGARGEDHAEDAAADPQLAAEPDRRRAVGARISTRSPRFCAKHPQIWVFADEIYSRLIYDGEFVSLAHAARHATSARSSPTARRRPGR